MVRILKRMMKLENKNNEIKNLSAEREIEEIEGVKNKCWCYCYPGDGWGDGWLSGADLLRRREC